MTEDLVAMARAAEKDERLSDGALFDTCQRIAGCRVIINDALAEHDLIPRTWRERLLTRPWRPWRAYRVELKPPVFLMDSAKGVIYTTQRGYLALKAETRQSMH